MFICEKCVERYEGPSVENAKVWGFQSSGKCEMCERGPRDCYDIPSSGDWGPKKKVAK